MKTDEKSTLTPPSNEMDRKCAMGLHSWIDEVGLLPPDTECERCGELYGHPD